MQTHGFCPTADLCGALVQINFLNRKKGVKIIERIDKSLRITGIKVLKDRVTLVSEEGAH